MPLWLSAIVRAPPAGTGCSLAIAAPRSQQLRSLVSAASASTRSASTLVAAVAVFAAGRQACAGRRRRPCARRVHRQALPVDYYGLLGLSKFESDQDEIKAAHRRMVKLVHPDVLGGDSAELLRMVTEAYATLSDDAERAKYDATLGCGSGEQGFFRSTWHPEAPAYGQAVFVDQTQCVICFNCSTLAPDTFEINSEGRGRARVFQQGGDWEEDIDNAVESCPTSCISYVDRDDLPFLEEAIEECEFLDPHIMMRIKSGNMASQPQQSPFDKYRGLKAKRQESPGAGTISTTSHNPIAEAISSAASSIPDEARQRVWPG